MKRLGEDNDRFEALRRLEALGKKTAPDGQRPAGVGDSRRVLRAWAWFSLLVKGGPGSYLDRLLLGGAVTLLVRAALYRDGLLCGHSQPIEARANTPALRRFLAYLSGYALAQISRSSGRQSTRSASHGVAC